MYSGATLRLERTICSESPRLQGGASINICSGKGLLPLPCANPARIHPRPQDGAFCGISSTPPVAYLFPSRLPPVYVIWYLLNPNIPGVGAFFDTYYGSSILLTISYKNHNQNSGGRQVLKKQPGALMRRPARIHRVSREKKAYFNNRRRLRFHVNPTPVRSFKPFTVSACQS